MHYIQGDTILDGVEYMKLYTFGETSQEYMGSGQDEFCSENYTYHGLSYLIRSENRRMYIRELYGSTEELLLYDFNLEVGDTLPDTFTSNFNEYITISGIDSIEVNGEYYKRFQLQNSGSQYLMEGIGSQSGLFAPLGSLFDCGFFLVCYRQNETLYYDTQAGMECALSVSVQYPEAKPEITISPNPLHTSGTLEIGSIQGAVNVDIHDITGKIVRQMDYTNQPITLSRNGLQSGLYFLTVKQKGEIIATTKLVLGK